MFKFLKAQTGLAIAVLALTPSAALADRWDNIRSSCSGRTLKVSAQLMDIHWGQSWEAACARKSGRGVGFGITRKADRCINNAGMWGEWDLRNHPRCVPKYEWGEVKESCSGDGVQTVSAKLFNIPSGENWEKACRNFNAAGAVSAKGVSGRPHRCITTAAGIYGEWDKKDVAACTRKIRWDPLKKDGCFGPNRQVYSARLWDIPAGEDWVETCRATNGPNGLGKPSRCAKDALSTGVWGQWYTNERCAKPLEWGTFKDNGCVRDMKTPDANAGGISGEGFRSYSAVLYNAGGDWLEACRKARVRGRAHDGRILDTSAPTACVLADADDALSWITTAIIGAGTAFIASPTGPYAIAASGAAIAVVSKGAEAGLFELIDANLNVWGIVWVEDEASCGKVDYGSGDAEQRFDWNNGLLNNEDRATVAMCPQNASSVTGDLTCACSGDHTRSGTVWGSDIYTADSSICKAALHAGKIDRKGGVVRLQMMRGQRRYSGSTRNGVTTQSYGNWGKSYRFE